MGFPVGETEVLLPMLFLNTLTLLGFLRGLILTLLGLSDILEPGLAWPDPSFYPTRPESASASLIREMLPVVKFSDVVATAKEEGEETPESCTVCLYEFEGEEEIRPLRNCRHIFHRNCRHIFHRNCLDRWMDHDQGTCPLCRTHFLPEEEQEAFNQRL